MTADLNFGAALTDLLWRDGQVGSVVYAEKHVIDSSVVSSELAGHLAQVAQEWI